MTQTCRAILGSLDRSWMKDGTTESKKALPYLIWSKVQTQRFLSEMHSGVIQEEVECAISGSVCNHNQCNGLFWSSHSIIWAEPADMWTSRPVMLCQWYVRCPKRPPCQRQGHAKHCFLTLQLMNKCVRKTYWKQRNWWNITTSDCFPEKWSYISAYDIFIYPYTYI